MSILQRLPILRSALEAVGRGRKIKRQLPNGVKLYVSPDSQLKYLSKLFDIDLVSIAKEQISEKSVVWDIGANCGVFSFSSSLARQVVAVEADPFLCCLIQDSISMNGIPILLVSAAASSSYGIAEFSIAKRGRASNHLSFVSGSSQTGGERSRILVPTITLDGLLDSVLPPTFVKIDVEGAEVEVLNGARRLLREVRPVIYLETVQVTHAACALILEDAGYTLTKGAEMNWLCTPQ